MICALSLSDLLAGSGYAVVEAANGQAGVVAMAADPGFAEIVVSAQI
jgi:hypothetical protein